MLGKRMQMAAAGIRLPTLSFIDSDSDTVNRTTYTFSSKSFGAVSSDRLIAVGIVSVDVTSTTANISTVTIGGQSATVHENAAVDAGTTVIAGVAWATVPTGTTGDIVVTFDQQVDECVIAWWRITDLQSSSAYDTAVGSLNMSIDFAANGVGIFAVRNHSNNALTWSGATERAEPFNGSSFADHQDSGSGESGRTVDANASGTETQAGVTWR